MTRPLRILTVAPLPPEVSGGIEEYAYSVIRAQRAEGNVVTIATTGGPDAGATDGGWAPVMSLESKMILDRPIVTDPQAYLRLWRAVRSSDVTHLHMPFPLVEVFVAFAARVAGRPLVVTYHMDAVVDESIPGRTTRKIHRWIERVYALVSARPTVELASRVCTNTAAYARESRILQHVPEKVLPVHQGIDQRKFQCLDPQRARALRERYLGGTYARLAVFVGRFVPYKGIEYLIGAAERLRDQPVKFVLGGKGPLWDEVDREVRARALTNVELIGFVPDDDLANLFYAADVVVSPSVSMLESTPITLLYATALGTRVIGTSIGGTEESIPSDGARGAIVAPRDVDELTHALRTMLSQSGQHYPAQVPRFWSDVAADYTRVMLAATSESERSVAHVLERPAEIRSEFSTGKTK